MIEDPVKFGTPLQSGRIGGAETALRDLEQPTAPIFRLSDFVHHFHYKKNKKVLFEFLEDAGEVRALQEAGPARARGSRPMPAAPYQGQQVIEGSEPNGGPPPRA